MTRLKTKPSTPKLSEAARHLVYPSTIVSTGWPRIERRLSDMAVQFDPWQVSASKLILGKRADGKYAATVGGVVWSIPRQVGKTFTIGSLLIAMCIEFPGLKVVWTAHRTRTATDAFRSMQGMVRRKRVAPHVKHIRTANGEQEIAFRNGSVIMFGAREQGFGRGFTELDVEVFDEAQILGVKALEDMIAATNQARHPHGALLFFLGTPPRPGDPSEAFTEKRKKALTPGAAPHHCKADNLVYLEFSAAPDSDPDDRAQWPIMNPSHPKRTPEESLERLRENLPGDDAWNREGRGIWDEEDVEASVLPNWPGCRIDERKPPNLAAVGVAVDLDVEWAAIGAAGRWPDGRRHVSIPADMAGRVDHSRGTTWLAPRLLYLQQTYGCAVLLDEKCPDQNLTTRLREAGVDVTELNTEEMLEANSGFTFDVAEKRLTHFGELDLVAAIRAARRRYVGDRPLWGRKQSVGDITPLEAVTIAHFGLDRKPDGPVELTGSLMAKGGGDGAATGDDDGADQA